MNKRRAFTLVELLVVVAIIGILSSLVTVGVMSAVRAAKQARIKMQMVQIELAIEQYKNKYGEYPPDFSDEEAVLRHIKKRWPRMDLTNITLFPNHPSTVTTGPGTWSDNAQQLGRFINKLQNVSGWTLRLINWNTPNDFAFSAAIPFWLGGLPNNADDTKTGLTSWPKSGNHTFTYLIGFSENPENPFDVGGGTTANPRKKTTEPLVEFAIGKNLAAVALGGTTNVVPVIFLNNAPVAYFKARSFEQPSLIHPHRVYGLPLYGYRNLTASFTGNINTDTNRPGNRILSLWTWDQLNSGIATSGGFGYRVTPIDSDYQRFSPGVACPYRINWVSNTENVWYNDKSYQLIHPGLDGCFGSRQPLTGGGGTIGADTPNGAPATGGGGRYATITGSNAGNGITQFDLDNIVNFGDGATIKALLP